MEREKNAAGLYFYGSASSTERFFSKLARRTRSENSRKRGPNETPLPHPQVSGGLGLGYMATSRACTERTKIPRFARDDNPEKGLG
jgi:hypothetical protein